MTRREHIRSRPLTETVLADAALASGFEHSPIGMALTNLDGTFNRVNAAFARLLGYGSPAELAGLRFTDVTPDDAGDNVEAMRDMVERDVPYVTEKRYMRKDGGVVWTQLAATVVRDSRGHPAMFFTQVEDVTERVLAGSERARLAAIVRASASAIMSLTLDGVIETWNAAAERLYGYPADAAIGRHAPTLLAADPVERAAMLESVAAGEVIDEVELLDRRRDGSTIDVAVTDSPIRSASGEIVGIARVARDISVRRAVERREREAQGFLRAITDNMVEGLISTPTTACCT